MKSAKKTGAPSVETAWENPLIPNKKLREIYTAMVELRLLEEHLATRQRRASQRLSTHFGQEGCLAATALSLTPGDLTSAANARAAIRFLRGAKLHGILSATTERPPNELPPVEAAESRLYLTLGAVTALPSHRGAKNKGQLAVAYVSAGELWAKQWKPIFRIVEEEAAPVIFVVLPAPQSPAPQISETPGKLSLNATALGVPGIPVDAADPVALYRVAQEGMLRARAGGGPMLMECVPFQLPGKKAQSADPIVTMREFLRARKVADHAWFESVAARIAARLDQAAR